MSDCKLTSPIEMKEGDVYSTIADSIWNNIPPPNDETCYNNIKTYWNYFWNNPHIKYTGNTHERLLQACLSDNITKDANTCLTTPSPDPSTEYDYSDAVSKITTLITDISTAQALAPPLSPETQDALTELNTYATSVKDVLPTTTKSTKTVEDLNTAISKVAPITPAALTQLGITESGLTLALESGSIKVNFSNITPYITAVTNLKPDPAENDYSDAVSKITTLITDIADAQALAPPLSPETQDALTELNTYATSVKDVLPTTTKSTKTVEDLNTAISKVAPITPAALTQLGITESGLTLALESGSIKVNFSNITPYITAVTNLKPDPAENDYSDAVSKITTLITDIADAQALAPPLSPETQDALTELNTYATSVKDVLPTTTKSTKTVEDLNTAISKVAPITPAALTQLGITESGLTLALESGSIKVNFSNITPYITAVTNLKPDPAENDYSDAVSKITTLITDIADAQALAPPLSPETQDALTELNTYATSVKDVLPTTTKSTKTVEDLNTAISKVAPITPAALTQLGITEAGLTLALESGSIKVNFSNITPYITAVTNLKPDPAENDYSDAVSKITTLITDIADAQALAPPLSPETQDALTELNTYATSVKDVLPTTTKSTKTVEDLNTAISKVAPITPAALTQLGITESGLTLALESGSIKVNFSNITSFIDAVISLKPGTTEYDYSVAVTQITTLISDTSDALDLSFTQDTLDALKELKTYATSVKDVLPTTLSTKTAPEIQKEIDALFDFNNELKLLGISPKCDATDILGLYLVSTSESISWHFFNALCYNNVVTNLKPGPTEYDYSDAVSKITTLITDIADAQALAPPLSPETQDALTELNTYATSVKDVLPTTTKSTKTVEDLNTAISKVAPITPAALTQLGITESGLTLALESGSIKVHFSNITPYIVAVTSLTPVPPTPSSDIWIMGYYGQWGAYGAKYPLPVIPGPYKNLTHLAYAFMGFNPAGEIGSWDLWGDLGMIAASPSPFTQSKDAHAAYGQDFIGALWGYDKWIKTPTKDDSTLGKGGGLWIAGEKEDSFHPDLKDIYNATPSGSDLPKGYQFYRLAYAKKLNPNLKTIMSFGGWQYANSGTISDPAWPKATAPAQTLFEISNNDTLLTKFVTSIVSFIKYTTFKMVTIDGVTGPILWQTPAKDDTNNVQRNTSVVDETKVTIKEGTEKPLFDGVDIDWEYPAGGSWTPSDVTLSYQKYANLLTQLKTKLGTDAPVTTTVGGDPATLQTIATTYTDVITAWNFIDRVSIMSYDFMNGNTVLTHDSPLFKQTISSTTTAAYRATPNTSSVTREWNTDAAVKAFMGDEDGKVNSGKIQIGIPFYGRFQYVSKTVIQEKNGGPITGDELPESLAKSIFDGTIPAIYPTCSPSACPWFTTSGDSDTLTGNSIGYQMIDDTSHDVCGSTDLNSCDFTKMKKLFSEGKDTDAQVSYYISIKTITYNGLDYYIVLSMPSQYSVEQKANYIADNKLGGVITWMMQQDIEGTLSNMITPDSLS